MAQALEVSEVAFEERFVRTVADPATGQLRLSLREQAGRCVLLEGSNHCAVYKNRPSHCSRFPYWESVLEDPEGFERARSTCPGITPLATPGQKEAAFAGLEALYTELEEEIRSIAPRCEMSGLCCRFEEAGHELYATALEADYAAAQHPLAPAPEGPGRCPYHVAGRCSAREGRALGCRTYFCDESKQVQLEELHETYLGRIRELEQLTGYPISYRRFSSQLHERGVGVSGKLGAPETSEGSK